MAILNFPPVDQADEHGLLAIGGDLEISSLLLAYSKGVFPWPVSDEFPLAWFSPDPRGILPVNKLHISRSLKKSLKKNDYKITFNKDFESVINLCSESKNRKNQVGTWITDQIIKGYVDFHKAGHAYSVEVYNRNKTLVGGLYGTHMGGLFSGESMFYLETDTSKIALAAISIILQKLNIKWLDTQMVTPVVESMGGKSITRKKYLEELKKQLNISHDPYLFNQFNPDEIIEEIKNL